MVEGPPVAVRRAGLAGILWLIKLLLLGGVTGTGGSLRLQRRGLACNWAAGGAGCSPRLRWMQLFPPCMLSMVAVATCPTALLTQMALV